MLDRDVIGDFLDEEFVEAEISIPEDIEKTALVEAFCQFVEDDFMNGLKITTIILPITIALSGIV